VELSGPQASVSSERSPPEHCVYAWPTWIWTLRTRGGCANDYGVEIFNSCCCIRACGGETRPHGRIFYDLQGATHVMIPNKRRELPSSSVHYAK
jgi:hypothetical protein